MGGSIFGRYFRVSTFGESHGPAIGCVIDGCPAGLSVSIEAIQQELNRRRPGQSGITSPRDEKDRVEVLSGLLETGDGWVTLGTPIAMLIRNEDARPQDYSEAAKAYRPSHADYTYDAKYGIRDARGGGRSSARETAARVAAGAIAQQLLATQGIEVVAWVQALGGIQASESLKLNPPSRKEVDANDLRCPDVEALPLMQAALAEAMTEGDTLGGIVGFAASGVPAGLGEPVFDKLHAELGKAFFSINAVKGVGFGEGFGAATMRGSAHNDAFETRDGQIRTATNRSGGIQGGISNGEIISAELAFKPIATLRREQATVTKEGEATMLGVKGRHDPTVLPRAVPIVEAMGALVLADAWLAQRLARLV